MDDIVTKEDMRELFEDMSIFELRNYARGFGVKSATSKNKPEIIENIFAIENGTIEPVNNSIKGKGRPPKVLKTFCNTDDLSKEHYKMENKKLRSILQSIFEIIKMYVK